ncbi:PBSX family phage terminase large subunit [Bombilactobacillus folatiphilus]|uniref:PBSX family phage terminase large subunit n=1 Tax=Bombilactobacillus folatiphilus TaxID=2923362 RepID=A0ABY4PB53_9LACO|nr:PBSX family phage terminase large subunit [Bombilactobacillus folatiphilus]UQS82901.1 PBSX family phage terminase large subunit [Bombilactobacillus folatiphilus]
MPTINIKFPHPSHVFNRQVWEKLNDYEHFTEIWYGGASSGKSHGVVQKVVIKALKNWKYPRKILFTRKVGRSIKDSIFSDVLDCLKTFKLLDLCKVNKTDFTITLPNGGVFLFKGMDDPEKIKSIKGLSDVVMEEATEFNLEDYTQLTLRLREPKHKQRQIYLMFNPVSKLNWVYKQFFDGQLNDPDKVVVYQSTYTDNRFLDEDNREIIENLKNTNPAYYKIYALGDFATLDKLVFPSFETKRLNPNSDELKDLPSMFGLDFGYVNDPSAFIHVKVDVPNKVLYAIEEYTKKGLINSELAKVIKDLGYEKEVITADAAEKKSIEEMRRNGIYRIRPAKKGPDSIIQGISFLQQFKLVIDDRCVKMIEELENYTYQKDKKSGEYINKPIDSYNHVIDATRYAVEEINGKGSPKIKLSKNILF